MTDEDKGEFDVEAAQERLLEEIVGCYNCQPWDDGEIVWLGPNSDLEELLQECGIEEEHWEEVLEGLSCPNCGTDLNKLWDEVELKSEYDKSVEKVMRQAKSTDLVEKLRGFNDFIKEYPYLGLCDPEGIGNAILNKINKWKRYKLATQIWYRARRLNEESKVFPSSEMGAPDPKKTYIWEGRYNHTGQSFLYLSDHEEVAFKEIKNGEMNICAMQKFKALSEINVLDLRQDYHDIDPDVELLALSLIYNGFVSQKPEVKTSWKPEYFVSRYVADCARKNGYDGILFSSVVHSTGENLVVFPNEVAVFTTEEESYPYYSTEQSTDATPQILKIFDDILEDTSE